MSYLRRLLLAVLVAVTGMAGSAVLVGAAPVASADETRPAKGSWSVQPGGNAASAARSVFTYTLAPGTVLRDTVALSNTSTKPVQLNLYSADAYLTGDEGAFAIRNPGDPREGVSRWVKFGKRTRLTIPPGKALQVPFEVRVPKKAEPGDHVGAVIAAGVRLEKSGGKGALGFDVRRRVGARIYLRVEGPLRPNLSVSSLQAKADPDLLPFVGGDGCAEVTYEVSNPGNVRITPEARLELVGPLGMVVDSQPVELPELLPGSTITRTASFDSLPSYGMLRARLVMTSDDTSATSAVTIWALPWASALVVLLLGLTWWLRRRRRQGRPLLPGGGRPRGEHADPVVEHDEHDTVPEPVAR